MSNKNQINQAVNQDKDSKQNFDVQNIEVQVEAVVDEKQIPTTDTKTKSALGIDPDEYLSSINAKIDADKYPLYSKLKKFVINLDSRPDRLENTRNFFGDEFIRIQAVNGETLTYEEIIERFHMRKCNSIYKGNQTPREVACVLSHYNIYQQVANDDTLDHNDWVLICEDDNWYDRDFAPKLDQLLQFLSQKRFEYAHLVVLKHSLYDAQIDYLDALKALNKEQQWPKYLKEGDFENYSQAKVDYLADHSWMWDELHMENDNIFSFEYKDVREPTNPELYSNTQRVFAPTFLHPRSAALYLIRKRTCKRIIKNHPRAFWFADDFKQIVPVQSILFISPFLGFDPPEETGVSVSSININSAYLMHRFNKIHRERNRFTYRLIRTFKLFSYWYYSTNVIKRRISRFCVKLMNKILFLKY